MTHPSAANRLVDYVLCKLESEPLTCRANLYEDLAEFLPSESMAGQLREQARALRSIEQQSHAIKLAMRYQKPLSPCT